MNIPYSTINTFNFDFGINLALNCCPKSNSLPYNDYNIFKPSLLSFSSFLSPYKTFEKNLTSSLNPSSKYYSLITSMSQ